jgi:hypothetical protein
MPYHDSLFYISWLGWSNQGPVIGPEFTPNWTNLEHWRGAIALALPQSAPSLLSSLQSTDDEK